MEFSKIKEVAEQVQWDCDSLVTSFLHQNNCSYSNIFHNKGDKILGRAMYDTLKDLVLISKLSWTLDRNDFIGWINDIFDELELIESEK